MAKSAQQRSSGQSIRSTTNSRGAVQRGSGGAGGDTKSSDVFDEAMRRANEVWLVERANVDEGRDCQNFYVGGPAQWDAKAFASRQQKNRPTLTINRLPQFVKQLTGDVRKNPPAMRFLPAKGKASQETAEAYNGIARHIEQQSQAKDCYVKAVENAAQASQGFFRVVTEYSSDDGFELDIRIRPILDPFGAMLDPYAQLFDKSDMRYAYVFERITVEDFEKEWPDAAQVGVSAPGVDVAKAFPWRTGNTIRIAEYWRKVPVTKMLYMMPDGSTTEDRGKLAEEMPEMDIKAALKEGVIRSRKVNTHKVEMYRVCGSQVLDGPHEWPGRYIPICMVVGEEVTMDGSTVRKGMVHDARDPQRIYNYSRSASVEAVALQPKAPFIGTVDQFKGRPEWSTAGSENHAFLAYNPDPKMANTPPKRSEPALASQGLDQQAAIASDDMKAVTGIYDASLGARSNETAGVAIRARQTEGDTATYLYVDNLTRAIAYCGRILTDLIPRVYDTQRQVRILKEDGTADMVTVNGPPAMGPPGKDAQGQPTEPKPLHPLYDLSAGEYDVVVTTGPTFATQRVEAQENIIQTLQAVPQIMQVAPDIVFKMMDWPGADELAKRFAKTLPPGLTEDGPVAAPPPDPEKVAGALKNAAQADLYTAQATGQKITDAALLLQMHTTLISIQQMLAGGAVTNGPQSGGQPAGPSAPPPAPGGQAPGAAPPNTGPPMVELSNIGGAPV